MVSIPGQETASSSSTAREPRVTLVMVAVKAGVSKSTAGYVLTGQDQRMRISEQTRHKVLRAAAEMNYRPNVMARSLRTVVTRPIAIVSDTLATEAYGGELIEGCLSAAASHGRLTFIGETRRDPELQAALIEEFLAEQVSAGGSPRGAHVGARRRGETVSGGDHERPHCARRLSGRRGMRGSGYRTTCRCWPSRGPASPVG